MMNINQRRLALPSKHMRHVLSAAGMLVAFLPSHVSAQDTLSGFLRGSTTAKPYFAAFDVRPTSVSSGVIQEAVAAAFRVHYNDIVVNQQMPPYPLPDKAPRMGFTKVHTSIGPVSNPVCDAASSIISSSDSTMLKYGEVTILQACIFPYKNGNRVNVYAFFGQKSGGSSIATLGASLGRVVTNAVGLGDTSKFISETIDDIDNRLKTLSSEVRLVELMPERAERPVVADIATPMTVQDTRAQAVTTSNAMLPPGVQAQLTAAMRAAQLAVQGLPKTAPTGSPTSVIQARKDLSGMGLSYFNHEQFVDAVKRGDEVACDLFLQAGGVDPNQTDKAGMTPLQYAKTPGIIALLKQGPGQ